MPFRIVTQGYFPKKDFFASLVSQSDGVTITFLSPFVNHFFFFSHIKCEKSKNWLFG